MVEITERKKKYRSKSKSEVNNIGKIKESEVNDSEKTKKNKKNGREVFPCGICERNVGVSSKECKECKKWIHFRCHVFNNGIGWKNESDYKCPKCINGGVFKKPKQVGMGKEEGKDM